MRAGTDRKHGRVKRIFLAVAFMTALLGSLAAASASPASAATAAAGATSYQPMTTTSWWMYTWSHPNCIDDSRAHGLRAIRCDGYSYQEWRVTVAAHNSYELQNVNTGLCLDNSRGIRAIKCNRYSTYQDWL